jgi:hypothetical protein
MNNSLKYFRIISWKNFPYLLGFIYLFFCIIYTYERILNIDNSFYLFQIINKESFNFSEKRYGNWLSQLPLLIFLKLNFSLKSLVYIFSITFPCLYLLIIWLCSAVLKNSASALATMLSMITGVAYSFFHPVTETHQVLAFTCLFYAVLTSGKFENSVYSYYILSLLIELWCLFTHPIGIYTVSFVLAFAFLSTKKRRGWLLILFSIVMLMALLRITIFKEPYDARQYDELFKFKSLIVNFFNLYPAQYLIRKYNTIYLAPIILIITSILVSLRNKKHIEILISIGFSLFLIISSVVTYNKGDTDGMMEKSFMPAIFMFVILFAINFYNGSQKLLMKITLILSCFFSFRQIITASEPFEKRLAMLEDIGRYQAKNNFPKMIANYSDFDESILRFNEWSTAIDMLILSTCKTNTPVTLFLTYDKNSIDTDQTNNHLFLCLNWWPYWDNKDVNPKHFKLAYKPYKVFTK